MVEGALDGSYATRRISGGVEPIRSKILINHGILEQSIACMYLGYSISQELESDLNIKIINCVKILGIINQIFKPLLVPTHTRIAVSKMSARLTDFVLWQ